MGNDDAVITEARRCEIVAVAEGSTTKDPKLLVRLKYYNGVRLSRGV